MDRAVHGSNPTLTSIFFGGPAKLSGKDNSREFEYCESVWREIKEDGDDVIGSIQNNTEEETVF